MKRKNLLVAGLALLLAGLVKAASVVYSANAVDETALAYSKTYTTDLNGLNIAQVSFQAVYSSATVPAASFTDGTKSTGQITVASASNLTAVASTNTLTVTATANLAAVKATDNITIVSTSSLGNAYITFAGRRLVNGINWFGTNTTTGTAVSIAAALDSQPEIDAIASGSVVYATATIAGTTANSYGLASSTAAFTVASSSFTGGLGKALDNSSFTVNGRAFFNGVDWFTQPTSSETATAIAAVINRVAGIQASAAGSVVYATATTAGTAGNSFTLSGSTAALAAASPTFTNGRNNAAVTVGGITLTNGSQWTAVATASGTAKAISDAIQANPTLAAAIASTWTVQGIVYATSTVVGGSVNYTLATSIPASISVSGANMTGGTGTAIDLTAESITVAHTFTVGLPVLLTKSAGTTPAPLNVGTTYYVVPINATSFRLATTSTGAIAGLTVDITTQTAAGGGSFTLTPLTITGTPSFKWQVSNDAVNWSDLAVSSVTFASPYTAASSYWDLGRLNARYVRLNVVGPTTGGLQLRIIANGKDQ